MVTLDLFDRRFVLPALTEQFANDCRGVFGGSSGEFIGQLKVTLHTFVIATI